MARDEEIKDAVKDRLDGLMLASGHGRDEQVLMEKVLSTLAESEIGYGTVKRYLFEIWKLRDADDKRRRDRATQVIANLIAPVLRDIVTGLNHPFLIVECTLKVRILPFALVIDRA